MKTIHLIVGMFSLGTVTTQADVLHLTDGTVLDGEIGVPTEVTVRTTVGEKRIPFSLLPADVQQRYWRKSAEEAAVAKSTVEAPAVSTSPASSITADDIIALANEVGLDTWGQVTAIGSFRDRPEKRGTGGLVVTKAFNALEENWVTVYSPKDPVGQAGNWDPQVAKARHFLAQTGQFMQRRWLENFIKAGEAVARRDSNEFALLVRELRRNPLTTAFVENPRNFFTAK
ncbi:hypothetical protein ACXR0O_21195 [Verrucomicrobiota bacterium sgz303538]